MTGCFFWGAPGCRYELRFGKGRDVEGISFEKGGRKCGLELFTCSILQGLHSIPGTWHSETEKHFAQPFHTYLPVLAPTTTHHLITSTVDCDPDSG